MGILSKIFAGGRSKTAGQLKQLDRLLDSGKLNEAADGFAELTAGLPEDATAEDRAAVGEFAVGLARALLENGRAEDCLKLAGDYAGQSKEALLEFAKMLTDARVVDERSLDLLDRAIKENPKEKRLLLELAKNVLEEKGANLDPVEWQLVHDTTVAYPLWKEGLGVLADRYLNEDRKDAEALRIYRNTYPNRKADVRLRDYLLDSLIANEDTDEFAASVYQDAIETSDNPQALRLLAQYYIGEKRFDSSTIPYIQRALESTQLSKESLKELAELALASSDRSINKLDLLMEIYRHGHYDRNMLAYLGEALAQANKFDDLSIEIMTRAFELKVVSKREVLILTEHCLANDREDDFALSVYETYLSTWPDRPQRRIYELLGHHYAELTRVDDQAQKIYEEALVDHPTDPVILSMLARAYHAADRRDDAADEIYRHAFPNVEEETRISLARILAETRVEKGEFSEETLKYLTIMGRPNSGPLKDRFDEALTSCFLVTGRRGEQAQEAYFALFQKTEETKELNPRLVELLSEIIKERGVKPGSGSIELRVYYKLFELQKFATDPEIAFVLLENELAGHKQGSTLHISVRCFESDTARFIDLIKGHNAEQLLKDVGDFYIEHFNFPLAAKAYAASFELAPTDHVRYHLAKIQLLDGNSDSALDLLKGLAAKEYKSKRSYWEAVAWQQKGEINKSESTLAGLGAADGIPTFLIELRQSINQELLGNLDTAMQGYRKLAGQKEYQQFDRWISLEIGIVLIKLNQLQQARDHLEEVHRVNSSGRAEQLFFSLALFYYARELLRNGEIKEALALITRAIEVNRNDRQLRQVAVDVLGLYGQKAFFAGKLDLSVRIFETSLRILPKQASAKTYLAYTYHLLEDFARAIIHYRDIGWSDENPRMQRSQAYAYILNNQPEKAWRVFLDLARRGNLQAENFPRLVNCFLRDADAAGGRFWVNIEFGKEYDPIMVIALLIHDGQYEEAVTRLNKLLKQDEKNTQVRWYLGKAYSSLGKKELAVFNWKELIKICSESDAADKTKVRQLTEIGLALLEAGYAAEAMATWDLLRKFDATNPDLPLLYADTLNLNAFQLARKGQDKLASAEWEKAVKQDPENPELIQNYAISCLQLMDLAKSTKQFQALSKIWQAIIRRNPRESIHLVKSVSLLEQAMNTFALTKGRPDHDVTKARAEDTIETYRKANQFYWILSLDKRASKVEIEREYFRLIKIFNPERHADDFMLVEESYTNLFKSEDRRRLIDTFVYNPLDVNRLRGRLSILKGIKTVSFESLDFPSSVPAADYRQLEVTKATEQELAQPLEDLLEINFKIPDWTIL